LSLKTVASKLFQNQSSSVIAAWVGIGLLCIQLLSLYFLTGQIDSYYMSLTLIPISSLAGAGLAYLCSWMFFRNPFDSLIAALRARGDNTKIPNLVKGQNSSDMNMVVDEFNTLIDEQKKAARQVKVKQQYLEYAAHHDPLTSLTTSMVT